MATSTRFDQLNLRIQELREHLLPGSFDPTGDYDAVQNDRTLSFRLLAHAEIESYLEDIVVETANHAFEAWADRGAITGTLLAMLAYPHSGFLDLPTTKPPNINLDLRDRIERARNQLNRFAMDKNNGILEANILKLLLPVGISEAELDSVWLATADSFGRLRGGTAHRSFRVEIPPDPKNELDIVTQIVDGLTKIDEQLLSLVNTESD